MHGLNIEILILNTFNVFKSCKEIENNDAEYHRFRNDPLACHPLCWGTM